MRLRQHTHAAIRGELHGARHRLRRIVAEQAVDGHREDGTVGVRVGSARHAVVERREVERRPIRAEGREAFGRRPRRHDAGLPVGRLANGVPDLHQHDLCGFAGQKARRREERAIGGDRRVREALARQDLLGDRIVAVLFVFDLGEIEAGDAIAALGPLREIDETPVRGERREELAEPPPGELHGVFVVPAPEIQIAFHIVAHGHEDDLFAVGRPRRHGVHRGVGADLNRLARRQIAQEQIVAVLGVAAVDEHAPRGAQAAVDLLLTERGQVGGRDGSVRRRHGAERRPDLVGARVAAALRSPATGARQPGGRQADRGAPEEGRVVSRAHRSTRPLARPDGGPRRVWDRASR
jgi:hypothetical protein